MVFGSFCLYVSSIPGIGVMADVVVVVVVAVSGARSGSVLHISCIRSMFSHYIVYQVLRHFLLYAALAYTLLLLHLSMASGFSCSLVVFVQMR